MNDLPEGAIPIKYHVEGTKIVFDEIINMGMDDELHYVYNLFGKITTIYLVRKPGKKVDFVRSSENE